VGAQAVVLYSTGTGNSFRVACWAREIFADKGIPCVVRQITTRSPEGPYTPRPGDYLGVSVPTHGFGAQWSVLKKVFALPRGNGCIGFVTACCAGMMLGRIHVPGVEGTAAWGIALMLALKGYKVRAVNGVDMPSNWIVVHPGFSNASAATMSALCRKRYALLLDRVTSGRTFFPARSFVTLVLGIALVPVTLGYNLLGRFVLSKMLFADKRCTSCGQCARSCPVAGITMRNHGKLFPRWSFTCESCMRCVGFCPERAIQMNTLWLVGVSWLLFNGAPALADALRGLLPGTVSAGATRILDALAQVALVFGGSWLLGEALFFLSRIPGARSVLMYTSLSQYYRRYHEPLTRAADLQGGEASQRRGRLTPVRRDP
jgi:NAD-dependent dihydropyrimidine dehydrogenase PreA subunit